MANLLTGLRLLLALPVAFALFDPGFMAPGLLLTCVLIGIVTDWLDGRIARATGTATASGQLFDHGSDFIFVTGGMAGAAMAGTITWVLPLLVPLAFSQYVLDSYYLFRQKNLRMNVLGRINGICYFIPLLLISFARLIPGPELESLLLHLTALLAWLLVLSTLASMIDRASAETLGS